MDKDILHIRDYKAEDFNQVNALWNKTGLGNNQRADDNSVIANTIEKGGKLIILEDKNTGEIIGTSWITNDGRRLYLHHFGIKISYQGQGLSKLLLQKSLEFAKSMGLQIKLEVHESNTLAIEIYKKAGFNYLGDYNVYIIRDYKKMK